MSAPLTIDIQPADVTVPSGSTARFTAAVSGGTEPYTCQWFCRKSAAGGWVAVTAASGKTAQERHNGYQYCCRLSDASEASVESVVVTLTVQ